MKVVIVGNSHLDQFTPHNFFSDDQILVVTGASIRGLKNDSSYTGLNKKIKSSLADAYIFHLGMVDIEFGYYFKSSQNNKKLNKQEFIAETISIYSNFLLSLQTSKILIIGLNPTTITDMKHTFIVNYQDRSGHKNNFVQETGTLDEGLLFESFSHIYNESIEERNMFLYDMNQALCKMCKDNNFIFFNLWDDLIGLNFLIKPEFQPSYIDHHLVTSPKIFNKVKDMFQLLEN